MPSVFHGRIRIGLVSLLLGLAAFSAAQMRERVWARYEAEMQDPVEDPPDAGRRGEFRIGRLRYRSPLDGRRFGGYARWGIDANKGDRLFIGILRRLTRIDVEPIETIIDVDSDEIFETPFLLAISVGDWVLSPSQAKRIGEYLRRGGFLMVDDFHSSAEWATFMESLERVFPDVNVVDIPNNDPIFHVLYDVKEIVQIPSISFWYGTGGGTSERGRDSATPTVRAVSDRDGRVLVVMTHNSDFGDAFEREGDSREYFERFAGAGYAFGVNTLLYSMTH